MTSGATSQAPGAARQVGDADPILEIHALRKSYGDFTLRDVSFSLPRGYIMGLVGPNGAGKTTIVKLLLNLVRRDAGEIRVFGLDAREAEVAIKARIGFVHERPAFYEHVTVAGMGAIAAPFYRDWDRALFHRLAADFDLPLRKRVGALSRGMRTKLALALAMAHHAELLVLDEPTSGLDPVFRRELLERLSAYIQDGKRSVLFSTHITSDLERVADYVTFIREGRVMFSTTKDEVLERWGIVKGGPEMLDAGNRRFLKGVEASTVGFTGLTDDLEAARRRFSGAGVVIERASLEDIMVYLGKGCEATRTCERSC